MSYRLIYLNGYEAAFSISSVRTQESISFTPYQYLQYDNNNDIYTDLIQARICFKNPCCEIIVNDYFSVSDLSKLKDGLSLISPSIRVALCGFENLARIHIESGDDNPLLVAGQMPGEDYYTTRLQNDPQYLTKEVKTHFSFTMCPPLDQARQWIEMISSLILHLSQIKRTPTDESEA